MAISKRLVVQFLGDSSQLQGVYSTVTKDAQKFNKEIKNHGVSMQAVGKTMLAVGGTIVGALAATVVAVSKTGVEIDKMSKTTGVSREEIQKLGYAALQEHASMEQLSAGLVKLSKNMYDANMGTGEAKDTFEELGISVKKSDGTLRSSSDVLLDIADKFKGMTNETEISGAAMKLFGKSGAELVPFLRMGRDGIEELKKEAERLGIVMSEDSVKNMKAFDDSVTAVKAGIGGFATQIASTLVPYMIDLADGLKNAVEWFNQIPAPVRQAVTVGTALAGVVALISGAFIVLGPAILTALAGAWPFIAAAAALGAAATVVYNNWYKVAAFFMTVWDKVVAATQIAWDGIKFYILSRIDLILKGLAAFTSWIPGWGDKLKGAIAAVEGQMHSSLDGLHKNQIALTQNRYKEHYDWMVENSKKKNTDIQKNENDANNDKNKKTKEQLDKEKKAAEQAAKERLNIEQESANKYTNAAISAQDKIVDNEKKSNTERLAALSESLKLRLEALKVSYEKEKTEAEKVNADTTNITKSYNLEKTALEQDAAAKEKAIIENSKKNNRDLISLYTEVERAAKDRADAISTESGGIGLEGAAKELYDLESQFKDTINGITRYYEDMTATFAGLTQEQKDQYIKSWTDAGVEFEINGNGTVDLHRQILNEQLKADKKYAADKKKILDATKLYNEQLDKAYKDGNVKRYKELLNSEQGTLSARLAGNQKMINAYYEAWQASHRSTMSYMAEAMQTTYSGLTNFFADILKGTESISGAWSNLKDTIANMLAQMVAQWLAGRTAMLIFGQTAEATLTASSVAAAAAAAAAWAPAAAAVSLVSWGANSIPAMAGMTSAYALSKLLSSITGLAEGGLATGPSINLIGEGKHNEAVLPLSDEVFAKIGEGIVRNRITNNNNTSTNNNPTVINNSDNRTINLGRYVDKSGLKKLWRDLEPIKTSEDKRKGK
jgi:hypothetical protein